ncbi:hypothetical protein B0H19DRAFT_1083904 [Mycena capillaripes]|nr:hypothetical protein B0H19DRAFT_1083904 [Mycena capillaripes]
MVPIKENAEPKANDTLRCIVDGEVGIDTEFTDRRLTIEEHTIIKQFTLPGSNKRTALLGWQRVELAKHRLFPIAWDNIGLRPFQIAKHDVTWLLDMWKIRAFPKELCRVLLSNDMKKTGVSLSRDISVIWDDLRTEMKDLVDAGMISVGEVPQTRLRESGPEDLYEELKTALAQKCEQIEADIPEG